MSDLVLEILEGRQAGRALFLAGPLEVGRSQEVALPLDDTEVSRHHARIEPAGDVAIVTDLGSTNGTFVNDQPIHGPRAVGVGDRIRTGLTVLELRSARQVAAHASAARPTPPLAPVQAEVLRPVDSESLPGARTASAPRFAGGRGGETEDDPAYAALAALVDARVKRRTSTGALAFLSLSALVVLIFFGVR